jgi:hypothetical protein
MNGGGARCGGFRRGKGRGRRTGAPLRIHAHSREGRRRGKPGMRRRGRPVGSRRRRREVGDDLQVGPACQPVRDRERWSGPLWLLGRETEVGRGVKEESKKIGGREEEEWAG